MSPRFWPAHPRGRPPEQKEAVLPEDLLAIIAMLDLDDLRGLRDRILLLASHCNQACQGRE